MSYNPYMQEVIEQLPCVEKMTFDTQEEAQNTALAADWQHGAKLKPYKCRHCELWHLSGAS